MAGDPRQLPFLTRNFNKIVMGLLIGVPLFWGMHMHLDYSSETHPPRDDNPVSYLAYSLKHLDNDATRAAHAAGNVSDHITSAVEGRPMPAPDAETTMPRRTIGSQVAIELCVPIDLINNYQSWDHPYPGSKMSDFKNALASFLMASGDPRVQYRVRNGAFENFNPASNPATLVYGVNAGSTCPSDEKTYSIPVMR